MILLNKFVTYGSNGEFSVFYDPYIDELESIIISYTNRCMDTYTCSCGCDNSFQYKRKLKSRYLSISQDKFCITDAYQKILMSFDYYNKNIYIRLDPYFEYKLDLTPYYYASHMNFKINVKMFIPKYKKFVLDLK